MARISNRDGATRGNGLERPASRKRNRPTVDRKIHFFRVEFADDHEADFDAKRMCQLLSALQWRDDSENKVYWEPEPGTLYGARVDGAAEFNIPTRKRLRFFAIRRNDLPLVELRGEFSPLSIPARGGLAEAVFITFFPKNVVGAIYNFHGPRLPRFGAYLSATLKEFPQVVFSPLIRTDALSRLDELQTLSSLKVRLSRAAIDHFGSRNTSITEMFEMMAEFGNATSVEIVLRARRRNSLSRQAATFAKDLFRFAARGPDEQEGIEELVVRGRDPYTRRLATFDLLSDHFIVNEQVVTQGRRSRALDVAAAYTAIESAYVQIKHELDRASTILIDTQ